MNKLILLVVGGTVLLFGGILAVDAQKQKQKQQASSFGGSDDEVISERGVHWHPELVIMIKGQKQEVSADIGIGVQYSKSRWYDPMMSMTNIHNHDSSGQLHWEVMEGPVKRGHAKLAAFFEIWGKSFNTNQIFDAKNGEGGTVTMLVNGQPNTEFENYVVKDGDKIEIRYE